MKKIIWPLIGLVLLSFVLAPLFHPGFFTHHDDVHIIRLNQMDKCIRDGQIPCRWVPDLGGLYGYPLFNYYAPLPYYFGEIFHLSGFDLITSVKIMFGASIVLSAFFMYLLASSFWGRMGGVVSALFYSYAPYHAVDLYVRGAMGELWGMMFFPLILWAVYQFLKESQKRYLIYFILSVAGLMLSHNLLAMIFTPLILIFIAFILWELKKWQQTPIVALSLILSFGLAAFFWIPAILEKQYAHTETMIGGYFGYTEHFKGLYKLFIDRFWGWGASVREVPGGERDGISYQIGIVHLVLLVASLFLAIRFWRKQRIASGLIIFSAAVIFISIFMINPRSIFVWDHIPILAYLQFPWRLLAFTSFFISLIAGSVFLIIRKTELSVVTLIIILGSLLFLNKDYFRPESYYSAQDSDFFIGLTWDKQIKRSIFDFLPIFAKAPPRDLAESRYEILSGNGEVKNWQEGTDWINFNVNTQDQTQIRLSQYYFPGWEIRVNNIQMPINYDNKLGLMTINLEPGQHQIKARLFNTPVRSTANVTSILSLIIIVGVIFKFPKNILKK